MSLDRKEIETNIPQIIENISKNYKSNRLPEIVEPIQNSQDEYARLLSEGVLDDRRSLSIRYRVDLDNRTIEITDNAGGMSREVMSEVLPEIDRTSESKADGSSVGSMGRGLFAVAANAEKMYIETFNTDGERLSTVIYPDEGKALSEPSSPRDIADEDEEDVVQAPRHPSPEGTYLRLTGVDDDRLEKLADWEFVSDTLAEMFTPLFSRDDVELVYTIEEGDDVEKHTLDVTPLDELVDERVHEIDEHEFTANNEEYVLKDVVFGRAAQEYPWDGIALFKGNDYFDGPVMMVDNYQLRVASIHKDDPDMIAWCRIDECAELEDPSHQKLTIPNSRTDLRGPAQEVHAEHFSEQSASEEKELNRMLKETVDEAIDSLDDDTLEELSTLADDGALTTDRGEEELRSDDGDGTLLKFAYRDYPESLGEITTEIKVYPPESPDVDQYVIRELSINADHLNRAKRPSDEIVVDAVPDEVQVKTFEWEATEEGHYHISASIFELPKRDDISGWDADEAEPVDDALLTLPVGVEPSAGDPPQH